MNKLTKMMATLAVLLCCANQLYAATQTFDNWSSPSTAHNSSSSNTYTFTSVGNTILSFDWSVSCEEYFDMMIINLDGTNILTKSGKMDGTFAQELSEGEHTLVVTYKKDEAGSDGEDGCKILNVKVAPNTTISSGYSILEDWTSTNKTNGSTSSKTYIFTTTANAIVSFDWKVSSEAGGDYLIAILDGTTILEKSGEYNGTHFSEVGIGEHTLVVKYTLDGDTKKGSNSANITNPTVTFSSHSGMLQLPDWKSINKSDDSESAKTFTFCTNGDAILNYNWIVSSEIYDKLILLLDGKTIFSRGGMFNGQNVVPVAKGKHTLIVKYSKDESDDSGEDYGAISNVTIENILAYGTCGEKLNWYLYPTGLLKISGTGEMANYSSSSSQKAPWDSYKDSIVSVKIEDGVTTVGSYAFYEHTALTNIEFPKSIVSIGVRAFCGCTAFSSFTIPDGITTISDGMLSACSNLSTVILPESVTTIGSDAFANSSKLENINLPNGITSIKQYAFYNIGAATIVLPPNVTSIGNKAFASCSKIKSITIPQSVTTFGTYVFFECTGDLTINCNIPSDSYGVFYSGKFSKITIGEGVTLIGANAFYNCKSAETISIAETVKSIGNYAFKDCSALKTVSIPNSVTSIRYGAFYNCTSLESIKIPEGLTKIESYTFENCSALKSVSIPNRVTAIESGAFSRCSSLESIEIPSSVTSIGDGAFSSCSSLESIEIPSSVTSIGSSAFSSCSSLESIEIPSSVTSIGSSAFSYCRSLESIEIPNSVTSIGNGAFANCI